MYVLSPFVWRTTAYEIMVRAVNRAPRASEKVARVYHGSSSDGLSFTMDDRPAIAPGPGEDDRDGCEDPTVVLHDRRIYVFYSGWNQQHGRGQLLLARGDRANALHKLKVAIPSSESRTNPKEATIVRQVDGSWRIGWVLFDASYANVTARCDEPIIVPPPPEGEDTDIAFAASACEVDGKFRLYYTVADRLMKRATLAVR